MMMWIYANKRTFIQLADAFTWIRIIQEGTINQKEKTIYRYIPYSPGYSVTTVTW